MTLEEVCLKLKVSESSIKSNFARTQKNLLKKNIKLTKIKEGKIINYEIEYLNDNRAMTIYEELRKDIVLNNESINIDLSQYVEKFKNKKD